MLYAFMGGGCFRIQRLWFGEPVLEHRVTLPRGGYFRSAFVSDKLASGGSFTSVDYG